MVSQRFFCGPVASQASLSCYRRPRCLQLWPEPGTALSLAGDESLASEAPQAQATRLAAVLSSKAVHSRTAHVLFVPLPTVPHCKEL